MGYFKRATVNRRARRSGLSGFSGLGYTDDDQCSVIPIGDPYRKPGNYCATPDGGIVTFNSDGSVVRTAGGVDPDPAHPAGSRSSSGGIFDSILRALSPNIQSPPIIAPQSSGMSTTTMVAIAGGAVVAVYLLTRR